MYTYQLKALERKARVNILKQSGEQTDQHTDPPLHLYPLPFFTCHLDIFCTHLLYITIYLTKSVFPFMLT